MFYFIGSCLPVCVVCGGCVYTGYVECALYVGCYGRD